MARLSCCTGGKSGLTKQKARSKTEHKNSGRTRNNRSKISIHHHHRHRLSKGGKKRKETKYSMLRKILQIVIVVLVILANLAWVLDTIFLHENWDCVACRQDKDVSRVLQFIYYSIWGLWMNSFIIFSWVANDFSKEKETSSTSTTTHQGGGHHHNHQGLVYKVFQVAFPYAMSICSGYIYYSLTNPGSSFIDEDLCHRMGRAGVSKTLFNDDEQQLLVNAYLVLMIIWDLTMHYITPLVLLYLYLSKEIAFTPTWIPWSGILIFVLSVIIVLAQTYGNVIVYCDELWFSVITSVIVAIVVYYLVALLEYKKVFDNCCLAGQSSSEEDVERSIERSARGSNQDDDVEEGNVDTTRTTTTTPTNVDNVEN